MKKFHVRVYFVTGEIWTKDILAKSDKDAAERMIRLIKSYGKTEIVETFQVKEVK